MLSGPKLTFRCMCSPAEFSPTFVSCIHVCARMTGSSIEMAMHSQPSLQGYSIFLDVFMRDPAPGLTSVMPRLSSPRDTWHI